MTKIAIAGTGYVGMSLAVLLAQQHQVVAFDINPQRVDLINQGQTPIEDADISRLTREDGSNNLRANDTLRQEHH